VARTFVKKLSALTVLALSCAYMPARAADAGADLGACLTAKTTGTDRVALARWAGMAITAHPASADIVKATPQQLDASDRQVAALFVRLVVIECRAEARAAIAAGGNAALEAAFRTLGEAAMRETTTHLAVQERLTRFGRYIDKQGWSRLGAPAK